METDERNYIKITKAFFISDASPDKRYFKKMCDLYFNGKIPFDEVLHLFKVFEEARNHPKFEDIDISNLSYSEIVSKICNTVGNYVKSVQDRI